MKKVSPYFLLLLLASGAFTLATVLQPRTDGWQRKQDMSGDFLQQFLGEGRRIFANHFFIKADISFHGGYYPSIFDRTPGPKSDQHLTHTMEDEHPRSESAPPGTHPGSAPNELAAKEEEQHEKEMAFLGPPRDWIERFGRNFIITEHTHLEGKSEREILPWLRIAAELDPDKPETYTVAAYWLRNMGRTKEAEAFLREGLRNIPDSYELYFDMGRLYNEDYKDSQRAKNLWELALKKWNAAASATKEPDLLMLDQIAVHLSRLEEDQGNYAHAIQWMRLALKASPDPQNIQVRINELEQKLAQAPRAAHQ